MTDLAGRAEIRAAAIDRFRSVYEPGESTDWDAEEERLDLVGFVAVRDIATAAIAEVRTLTARLAAVEADRDRLQAAETTRRELVEGLVDTGVPDDIASILIDYGRVHGLLIRAEAERDEARAQLAERDALIAKAERWVANCIDPVAVGVDVKAQMLDELQAAIAASRPSPDTTEATG